MKIVIIELSTIFPELPVAPVVPDMDVTTVERLCIYGESVIYDLLSIASSLSK